MGTPNLSSYSSVQSNLFVRIQVDEYSQTPGGPYTAEVLRFSDAITTYTVDSESYTPLGSLMAITASASELRVSSGELTITLSGIPDTSIAEIVNSKLKGAPVRVYRLFSDATTGTALSIDGNPSGRFRGFVNNYAINEEWDNLTRVATNTLVLSCASAVDVLNRKISGRKTNPESQKRFYPTDLSMDRVPNLENATFNFGAPKQ
jgi:hypothetical protein